MVTSLKVITGLTSHASLAVGAVKIGVAGQLIVVSEPCPLITGAVMSCTLIVCDAVEELPQSSVAVQVLVTL